MQSERAIPICIVDWTTRDVVEVSSLHVAYPSHFSTWQTSGELMVLWRKLVGPLWYNILTLQNFILFEFFSFSCLTIK